MRDADYINDSLQKFKDEKPEEEKEEGPHAAITYLVKWKKDRENWKFQKVRQVWLLKNLYNVELITKKHFRYLLQYIDGLRGNWRQILIDQAESFIEEYNDDLNSLDSEDETTEIKYKRCKKVRKKLKR
eukprot:TRINITY_DN4572_c0_g1_i1.p1 TRINITY_DN4572_c0_g1~~TRINITY_DN4572_c0_g1_i1.p1  ORF type:complete len:129 (+),score=29.41 TRINITY_DN4572_c0_g1_i1:109-495(+)